MGWNVCKPQAGVLESAKVSIEGTGGVCTYCTCTMNGMSLYFWHSACLWSYPVQVSGVCPPEEEFLINRWRYMLMQF